MEQRTRLGQVALEPNGRAFAHGQQAALAVLTLADVQGAGGGIEIPVIQVDHFGAADPRGVKELQNRPVAQAEGIRRVGDGEKDLDFRLAQELGQGAGLFAGQFEIGGGIRWNRAGTAEPSEEAPDAAEAGELRVDNERPAAPRAAVMVKKELVNFDVGACERPGRLWSLGVSPCGKLEQRPTVRLNGTLRISTSGKAGEKGVHKRRDAVKCNGLRGARTALAASAHGLKIGKSGLS